MSHETQFRSSGPSVFLWLGYLVTGIWAQELTGGFDFLAPGLLVCLQFRQWWTLAWMTGLLALVQEGLGSLAFGVVILFYVGMFLFFLLSRWLLEPENPFFILLFSLCLSVWSWGVLKGAVVFQEVPAQIFAPWPWIGMQWVAYALTWIATLIVFHKWGRHGRV